MRRKVWHDCLKKKYFPPACPECGNDRTAAKLAELQTFDVAGVTRILEYMYRGWYPVLRKRHPVWQFPVWAGYCGQCAFINELGRDDYLLRKLPKSSSPRELRYIFRSAYVDPQRNT